MIRRTIFHFTKNRNLKTFSKVKLSKDESDLEMKSGIYVNTDFRDEIIKKEREIQGKL